MPAALTVTNSTFSGNQRYQGGAIYAERADSDQQHLLRKLSYGDDGGAIYADSTLTVTNSTFANNQAGIGPGIYAYSGGTFDHNLFYGGDICTGCTQHQRCERQPEPCPAGQLRRRDADLLPLPGSAAICAGTQPTQAAGLTTDERGQALDPNCPAGTVDIGAVQTGYALTGSFSVPSPVVPNTTLTPQSFTVSEIGGNLPAGNATVTVSDLRATWAPAPPAQPTLPTVKRASPT